MGCFVQFLGIFAPKCHAMLLGAPSPGSLQKTQSSLGVGDYRFALRYSATHEPSTADLPSIFALMMS